jgi:hypothetical protein
MSRKTTLTNETYRLVGTYERLRKALLELPDNTRLDKALSYWVLPTDRRLPIAFLDRTLRELLTHPLENLMGTPGVGQKKIMGFFDLMRRAAKTSLPDAPFGLQSTGGRKRAAEVGRTGFDASVVSEALWSRWCETVRHHGLSDQKLGRLAPSLQSLPTVIWHTALSEYVDRSLAQIRRLRTHGEKRVNAILEVFCTVHEAISTAVLNEHLDIDLLPRFVPPLERWLLEAIASPDPPTTAELERHLASPLVKQIENDLGKHVAELAAGRVQLDKRAPSVKQQAERIGVTRARVYQLLEDCGRVMEVRWPEGRWLLAPLDEKLRGASPEAMGLFHAIRDLFFPDGNAETAEEPAGRKTMAKV